MPQISSARYVHQTKIDNLLVLPHYTDAQKTTSHSTDWEKVLREKIKTIALKTITLKNKNYCFINYYFKNYYFKNYYCVI
jgi:hypothetical protein